MGGGERKSRDIDVNGILSYGCSEFLDKLDGIVDEESECAILVLANLSNHILWGDVYSL